MIIESRHAQRAATDRHRHTVTQPIGGAEVDRAAAHHQVSRSQSAVERRGARAIGRRAGPGQSRLHRAALQQIDGSIERAVGHRSTRKCEAGIGHGRGTTQVEQTSAHGHGAGAPTQSAGAAESDPTATQSGATGVGVRA